MLVWLAITLVLLLGVTALGIDVAYWQVTKNREQRAADAAALAGAVTFPGDLDSVQHAGAGCRRRQRLHRRLGQPARRAAAAARCAATRPPGVRRRRRSQLPVQGHRRAEGQQLLRRHLRHRQHDGEGERAGRVPRAVEDGQPVEPVRQRPRQHAWPINATHHRRRTRTSGATSTAAAPRVEQGDAYAANWCDTTTPDRRVHRGNGDGNNINYTPNGYYYAVDFTRERIGGPAGVRSRVRERRSVLQTNASADREPAGAAALTPTDPGYPKRRRRATALSGSGRSTRRRPTPTDPGWQYCTGDNTFPNSAGNTVVPTTTYTVLKATVPGHPESATQVCAPITFPATTATSRRALHDQQPGELRDVLPAVGQRSARSPATRATSTSSRCRPTTAAAATTSRCAA